MKMSIKEMSGLELLDFGRTDPGMPQVTWMAPRQEGECSIAVSFDDENGFESRLFPLWQTFPDRAREIWILVRGTSPFVD